MSEPRLSAEDLGALVADLPVAWLAVDAAARVRAGNAEAWRLLGASALGEPVASGFTPSSQFFLQTHVFPELGLSGRAEEVYVTLAAPNGPLPVVLSARRVARGDGYWDLLTLLPVQRQAVAETDLRRARASAVEAAAHERDARARTSAVEAQLAVSERLATMGTLAASVAHEINNPLAFALTNLDVIDAAIADATMSPAELGGIVGEVREGLQRIRGIVGSLKQLSRVETERREPVDLAAVVSSALKIVGAELRQRAHVEVRIQTSQTTVIGDEGRLCQVVVNLLVNATQALRDAPLQPGTLQHSVEVRVRDEGTDVVLEVADDGPGISEGAAARIFEPFYTTKPVGEGTGLGLAVCREIVSAMGGTIEVESAPGRGACFRVRAPAATTEPAQAPEPELQPLPQPQPGARVLLVEDERLVARAVTRALVGHEVVWCPDARAALDVLERDADFDLVLCDLMMPEMSGAALHDVITQRWPALAERALFMTGGAFTRDAASFVERMRGRIIHKPFDAATLRSAVAIVGRRSD